MKKAKDALSEETKLNDEFDIFDEWEEEEKKPPEAERKPQAEKKAPEAQRKPQAKKTPKNEPVEEVEDFEELDALEGELDAPLPSREVPEPGKTAAKSLAEELSELSPDVPVNLVAVIGKTTTNVGQMIKYRVGQVVDLGRVPGETVDLVANGRLVARGELVEMEGKMGVRIVKMVR